jgi:putative ABC transport system permease protein
VLFELDGVTMERAGKTVLRDVTARLPEGASCIAGPSGSGKSSLLRLLNRLADPVAGTVRYRGADVREHDVLELRREVCLVPQLPALLEGTVEDNIRFAADLAHREPEVHRLLDLAGLDGSFAERDAAKLSVGEQQRAMLARALALEPRVLLLDEPTSALDEDKSGGSDPARSARAARHLDCARDPRPRPGAPHGRMGGANRGRAGNGPGPGREASGGVARVIATTTTSIQVSLGEVAASLALVAVAAAISRWRRAELEQDIGIAVIRSVVQLIAIGYVINAIFDADSLALVFALIGVMVLFGAIQARQRARKVPDAFWPLLIALGIAGAGTLGLVVALGIFDPTPRYLVPVGGMVVGNSMTAAAVALNRLGDELTDRAREIEATLALGATSTLAAAPFVRRSLRSGMITLIDSTKTTGLVFFPGTMVGMLLAGADPTDAVRLQLILLYTLLGSVALAGLIAITLAYRNFFTPAHQLREQPEP